MRFLFIALLVATLTNCAAQPVAVRYQTVKPKLPPSLLSTQAAPPVPVCSAQSCVSGYLAAVYAWGADGWAQVAAIAEALTDGVPQ